jgi:hypothetical protein
MHVSSPTERSRRSASLGARHRALSVTLLAATLALLCCGQATAAAASSAGQCQFTIRVVVHRLSAGLGAYRSPSATAACTGHLGPWLMGGGLGWSESSGTLRTNATRGALTGPCHVTGGRGTFLAEVPRYAWFSPPLVSVGGSFRLRPRSHDFAVAGSGHLIRTPESPVSYAFPFTGSATLVPANGQACSASRWTGSLTLRIALP